MKTLQQASAAWAEYADRPGLSALKAVLWNSETSPKYIDELRSVCWKSLLLFQGPLEPSLCLPVLRDSRSAYASLRTHFLKAIENPGSIDETGADPLSEDEQSLWNSLRADEIVREEIWRDVERCMPDSDYFRDPRIQKLLLDVLFVWCKLNPDIGYRQGMHEILAPLVWVLDADAVHVTVAGKDSTGVVAEQLDARFVEHDAFTLFARVMQTAKSFYEQADKKSEDGEAPMIMRSRHIFEDILPSVDPELAAHLRRIDILPQIFLMRWVRLLFGREFPFSEVLEMWDLLFSQGSSLELVDYVCVTMLLRIRWDLLHSDMNSALTLLLRYPPLDNSLRARTLVRDARTIIQSPTLETGASLIIKYSGRPPAAIETLDLRSHTPSYGTPTRIRSPLAMASSPASLESLLADAAKGVMSRGERWGLNQAVRDVVGEVKRGVERGIQNAPDPSAWSRSASPRGFHQRTRSTKPTSESYGMITANVLRKMNALEDRNRKLAEMLDSAVKDLWNCHEKLAEKAKAEGTVDGEDGKFAEKLSKSVAEVQFVQAFLRDMTLPLPEPLEEVSRDDDTQQRPSSPTPTGSGDQSPKARENSKLATNSQPIQTPNVVADYHPTVISKPQRMPLDHEAGNASACIRSQASPESQPVLSGSVPTQRTPGLLSTGFAASSMPPPIPPTSITDPFLARPRLTSSSFSWMLADNNAEGQPFARATPFAPNEKRTHAKTGKGFLFGEDEDDRSTASGRSTKAPAGRKGSKSKVKSTSAAIREREAIGLGDVTVEDGKFDKEGGSGPPPL